MNEKRIRTYFELIEKGARNAQRRLLLINKKKEELEKNFMSGTPVKGGFEDLLRWAELPGESLAFGSYSKRNMIAALFAMRRVVEEEELPLLKRVDRGIRNFRRRIKSGPFEDINPELYDRAEYVKDFFNRISRLVSSYLKNVESQSRLLSEFKIGDQNSFIAVGRGWEKKYAIQKRTYRELVERVNEVEEQFHILVVDLEHELEKIERREGIKSKVRNTGRLITYVFGLAALLTFLGIFSDELDGIRDKNSILHLIVLLLPGVGTLGGFFTFIGADRIVEHFISLEEK